MTVQIHGIPAQDVLAALQQRPLRKSSSINATLLLGDAEISAAIIENISHYGMLLNLPKQCWLPSAFMVRAREIDLVAKVDVVWCSGASVGVRFVGVESTKSDH